MCIVGGNVHGAPGGAKLSSSAGMPGPTFKRTSPCKRNADDAAEHSSPRARQSAFTLFGGSARRDASSRWSSRSSVGNSTVAGSFTQDTL
jgi:hypothetical protein